MLSDEEKKEYIEHEILDRLYCLEEKDFDKNKVDDGYIKAVLNACKEAKNLIEKQSKEIEELKQDRNEYKEEYIKSQNARYYNYISKDKVKAKIEELKEEWEFLGYENKRVNRLEIDLLQSLLKEE